MVLVLEDTATSTANAEYEYEKAGENGTGASGGSNNATSKIAPDAVLTIAKETARLGKQDPLR